MHTITCTWTPAAPERIRVQDEARRAAWPSVSQLEALFGEAFVARLRLRGSLTLLVFDDEWRALTGREGRAER